MGSTGSTYLSHSISIEHLIRTLLPREGLLREASQPAAQLPKISWDKDAACKKMEASPALPVFSAIDINRKLHISLDNHFFLFDCRAVSYEISKHISAGNYKHCKL